MLHFIGQRTKKMFPRYVTWPGLPVVAAFKPGTKKRSGYKLARDSKVAEATKTDAERNEQTRNQPINQD
jgi:hypothetical protein